MSNANTTDQDIISKAIKLCLIEVLLGSVLHGLRVPFTGHFLSLNQGFLYCRFLDKGQSRISNFKMIFEISIITSCMKAIAPAGKKLGPMMSISMQGFLYGLGLLFGGVNLLGQIIGLCLLALWAFIQPFITYFLLFGVDLFSAFDFYIQKLNKYIAVTHDDIFLIAGGLIFIKLFIAGLLPFASRYIDLRFYEAKLESVSMKFSDTSAEKKGLSVTKGVIKDLTRPLFLLSFVLMIMFFILTGEETAIILWRTLRAFAFAFILFYLARSPRFVEFIGRLASRNPRFERIVKLTRQTYQSISNLQ